jgi:hypothetical protein
MFKKKMRVFHVLLLIILFACSVYSQDRSAILLSGKFNKVSLVSFFSRIETDYPIKFYYKPAWFENDTITVNLVNKPLPEVLNLILYGKHFTFRIIQGKHVVFLPNDQVSILMGDMHNYSDNKAPDESFVLVGKSEESGKLKMATVSGKVTDGKTGEPIIGAVIQVNNLPQGVVTNVQGTYKLALPPGLYTVNVSSVGYEKSLYNLKIVSHGEMNFELFDKSIALDDIIIYGQRVDRNVSSHQMSLVELDSRSIKQLPSVAGGRDILKGLTTMPGVKSIGEFSSGINVRGGGEDQNLYLINGTPLFNTSHVFGLFSVINPDAVEKLSLYKGHIPAAYGERVSSVVDIRTTETAPLKTQIRGGIGTYDSRLMANIPLYKNKVFLDIGGRTSYSDWILKTTNDPDLRNSLASFYDLNGTLHVNLGKSRLSLSGYGSNDVFQFASEVKYHYGSILGSLNWNYMFNSNLASYLTLSYSQYNVEKDDISDKVMQSRLLSGINYYGLKYRIKYSGISRHTMDAGFNIIKYAIQPGKIGPLNEVSFVNEGTIQPEQAYEGAFFVNDEYVINDYFMVNAGLRFSGYMKTGPESLAQYAPGMARDTSSITGFVQYGNNEPVQTYFGFEPRLSARLQFNEHSSVKISYNRNVQYLSLISYSAVSTPADIWKLSDPYVKPLTADQVAVGYYHNFLNNSIETSVEVYYKRLLHVIEYKDGAYLEMNPNLESVLLNATGKNYGIEFLLKKNSGKLDGWISYTYSRSLRRTDGVYNGESINNNRYFPSSYDRPNDFNTVMNYHVNKRLQFSANFTYCTGRPITLPEYKYLEGNEVVVFFSDKNAYRIPPYHRLDLTITLDESLRIKKRWKGSWSFSLLNVYGRRNAYTVFYKKEEPSHANDYNRYSLYKLYLIGQPVPTLSYSFIF